MSSSQQILLPSVEEITKWSPEQVIKFLETKKHELFLDEKHIKIIENEEIAGRAFLLLTKEDLRNYGLKGGPSAIIVDLVKTLKQASHIQEQELERLEALEKMVGSLLQKTGIEQAEQCTHTQEKGKKRVGEHDEQAEYEIPTKVLKISSTVSVKGIDEMNTSNERITQNTNMDLSHHREPTYNYLIEGNISYLVDLIKCFFLSRSMMSLKSMDEAVFQTVVEMLLPLAYRVPELRLVIDGAKQKHDGRFGFVDVFIPGGRSGGNKSTPSIVIELKYIKLTGLESGEHGYWIKSFKTEKLNKLNENLETEDEDVVLKRRYISRNYLKPTTVGYIMDSGYQQLQKYINTIARGPVKGYTESGVLDQRVKAEPTEDSAQLMGYVIMFVGTRRILVRSHGPIQTNLCWF